MGLSSSQARLLSLTSRQHDIEYKAQHLEAQKLQMANESTQVYQEYENALNETKIQRKTIGSDGSVTFVDATYQGISDDDNYLIKFENTDKIFVSEQTKQNFVEAANNRDYFIALETNRITKDNRTVDSFVEVYNAAQLLSMTSNASYRLMSDIDMSGNATQLNLSGINLDGNGHSITGLSKALFSHISNSYIRNMNISGASTSKALLADSVEDSDSISSTIENINVSGSVTSTESDVGALIGYISGNSTTVQNCSSNANVSSSGSYIGGLLGGVNGTTVENCSSSGSVVGLSFIGGLIGIAVSGAIVTRSVSNSSVTLQGAEINSPLDSGAFIGVASDAIIDHCASYGKITDTRESAAGYGVSHTIAGFIGATGGTVNISNCNTYSDVETKTDYIAGFIGAINSVTNISDSNSFGTLTDNYGDSDKAGFINSGNSGTISNCYSSDTDDTFVKNGAMTVSSQATSPVSNTIKVTPPTITTNISISGDEAEKAGNKFDEMKANGYVTESDDLKNPAIGHENDATWFTNMLNAGFLFLYKKDSSTNKFIQTNVATDTNLQEVSDNTQLKKAEAKYEADMRKIDAKDKKFDTDLAALETERNAIKTEQETLKSVAKDNVDRTFKLFG